MYPPNKKREALGLWFATYGEFSMAEFTAQLGYPDSGTMSRWIRADPRHDPDRAQYRSKPIAPKLEAIGRVAGGESVSSAARAVGLSRGQVRISVNMYAEGGTAALPPKATARRAAGMAKKRTESESESTPIPLTPFTPPSGGLRLWASWPLRTRRG